MKKGLLVLICLKGLMPHVIGITNFQPLPKNGY